MGATQKKEGKCGDISNSAAKNLFLYFLAFNLVACTKNIIIPFEASLDFDNPENHIPVLTNSIVLLSNDESG